MSKFLAAWTAFLAWFGPVAGAIAGEVNRIELTRVILLMLGSGTVAKAFQVFLSQGGEIIADPTLRGCIVPIVTGVVGLVEYYRRKAQGAKVAQS